MARYPGLTFVNMCLQRLGDFSDHLCLEFFLLCFESMATLYAQRSALRNLSVCKPACVEQLRSSRPGSVLSNLVKTLRWQPCAELHVQHAPRIRMPPNLALMGHLHVRHTMLVELQLESCPDLRDDVLNSFAWRKDTQAGVQASSTAFALFFFAHLQLCTRRAATRTGLQHRKKGGSRERHPLCNIASLRNPSQQP